MMTIPRGLNASEALNYRRGYSRAFGKYLKDVPAPSWGSPEEVREQAPAWHAEHDQIRHSRAHKAGVNAVRAYWKRRGISDRSYLLGAPVREIRKAPAVVTCQNCGCETKVAS